MKSFIFILIGIILFIVGVTMYFFGFYVSNAAILAGSGFALIAFTQAARAFKRK